MKLIALLILVITLESCSLFNKEEVTASTDNLEFTVDTIADAASDTEFKVEAQTIEKISLPDESLPIGVEEIVISPPPEPKFEDFKMPEEKNNEIKAMVNIDQAPLDGPMEKYRLQRDDTLMMVSFKIYGDYRRWKDIKSWNKNVKNFQEGVEVSYQVPDKKFRWIPNGLPYLVKKGDTLQMISMDKYTTTRKWKTIFNNNRPLIRDPNLIFAGFTLYYQPMRELASEKK